MWAAPLVAHDLAKCSTTAQVLQHLPGQAAQAVQRALVVTAGASSYAAFAAVVVLMLCVVEAASRSSKAFVSEKYVRWALLASLALTVSATQVAEFPALLRAVLYTAGVLAAAVAVASPRQDGLAMAGGATLGLAAAAALVAVTAPGDTLAAFQALVPTQAAVGTLPGVCRVVGSLTSLLLVARACANVGPLWYSARTFASMVPRVSELAAVAAAVLLFPATAPAIRSVCHCCAHLSDELVTLAAVLCLLASTLGRP